MSVSNSVRIDGVLRFVDTGDVWLVWRNGVGLDERRALRESVLAEFRARVQRGQSIQHAYRLRQAAEKVANELP